MKFIMNKKFKKDAKVVLIGAGPGDPDLLTLKGARYLQQADVVVYDYLANGQILSHCQPEAEKIYVGKTAGSHTFPQKKINQLLVEKAKQNGLVVRLKGGDPFVFGRGGEEVLALYEAGIDFEVVPGITAGIASLCYAGIPATRRGDSSSLCFITGHEDPTKTNSGLNWHAIANNQGTLVFYMGVKNLPLITNNLIKYGKSPDTPVALIRWGTLPCQQTIAGRLKDIIERASEANFRSPALIVVGDVVRYRNSMNWFEKKPLFGRKIVITRARAQSSDLDTHLRESGAEVVQFPTIKIEPPDSWQSLDNAIRRIENYHWIIFTSVNGVESFRQRLFAGGIDFRQLKGIKIAAIGPATADRLHQSGVMVDLQPENFYAEALIDQLKKQETLPGKKFLLPRAEEARVVLREELVKEGASVDEITAYRTVPETGHPGEIIEQIGAGDVDLITFTSSSTVRNFTGFFTEKQINQLKNVTIASIGPITEKTVTQYGLHSHIVADDYTIPGLVAAIINHYEKQKELS